MYGHGIDVSLLVRAGMETFWILRRGPGREEDRSRNVGFFFLTFEQEIFL